MPKNVFQVSTCLQEQIQMDANAMKLWDLNSLGHRHEDEVDEDLFDTISYRRWEVLSTIPLEGWASQMKRLKNNPTVSDACNKIIKEQVDTGITQKVPEFEKVDNKIHYLHHQVVVRETSET